MKIKLKDLIWIDSKDAKDGILEMFVEAGFEWDKSSRELIHETNNLRLRLCFGQGCNVWFRLDVVRLDDNIQSVVFNFNDRKQIEFYYNKFREILEFEVTNERN